MKRASYRDGVSIIALNDEPLETDVEAIRLQMTVCLLSDLFDVTPERVADDVVRYRKKNPVS